VGLLVGHLVAQAGSQGVKHAPVTMLESLEDVLEFLGAFGLIVALIRPFLIFFVNSHMTL
jgi:hypothetical protein